MKDSDALNRVTTARKYIQNHTKLNETESSELLYGVLEILFPKKFKEE